MTFTLSLTGFEVIYLSDALRNGDTNKSIEDELLYLKDLVRKLASVYNQYIKPDMSVEELKALPESDILVSQDEVWLLRSKVRTGDIAIDGKTNIGVKLLNKLYGVLLQSADEESVNAIIGARDIIDYDEALLTEEQKANLKEQRYARWQPDENSYSSRDAIREP